MVAVAEKKNPKIMDGQHQRKDRPVIIVIASHLTEVDGRPLQWRRLSEYLQRRLGETEVS